MRRSASRRRSWTRFLWLGLFLLVMAGGGIYIWGPWGKEKAPAVPTAEVKLGDFVDYVELRGEIRVRASNIIAAPYNAGELQILKLCRDGASIKKGMWSSNSTAPR